MPESKKKLHVADVVRYGEKIILPAEPTPMSYDAAIDVLTRKKLQEEEVVAVQEQINTFPWDGALALRRVLEKRLGAAITTKTLIDTGMGFIKRPPVEIAVEVAFGKTTMVTWGRYRLPGVTDGDDWLETNVGEHEGMIVFKLTGEVRRKYMPLVKQLADDIKREVALNSIYRGKAVRIRFYNDDGDKIPLPTPQFLDTTTVDMTQIIYADTVRAAIETNIFTPIRHATMAARLGVPTKRGVLLSGKYGTGKTLTAYATARVCEQNGWAFVYVQSAEELADAIRFANHYGPAVVFAEDIDRVTRGDRTPQLDEILNTVDGVDTKQSQVMVILTTNFLGTINEAMLRPGRLDAVIEIEAPDQGAVERLIRVYAQGMLDEDTDVSAVAKQLAGQIPATIREVVERSKLYWLTRTNGEEKTLTLAEEDIFYAASTVLAQIKLTQRPSTEKKPATQLFGESMGDAIATGLLRPGGWFDAHMRHSAEKAGVEVTTFDREGRERH